MKIYIKNIKIYIIKLSIVWKRKKIDPMSSTTKPLQPIPLHLLAFHAKPQTSSQPNSAHRSPLPISFTRPSPTPYKVTCLQRWNNRTPLLTISILSRISRHHAHHRCDCWTVSHHYGKHQSLGTRQTIDLMKSFHFFVLLKINFLFI